MLRLSEFKTYHLVILGLVVIPFYELMIRILPYASVIVTDSRAGKLTLAIWIALAAGLLGLYRGEIRKVILFPCLILFFNLISIRFAPKIFMAVNDVDSSGFWMWRPSYYMLCFFLYFAAVSNLIVTRDNINSILKTMFICGSVMAGYCILQSLGFDQFYYVKPFEKIGTVTKPEVIATLGNSTLVSSFIAMVTPIGLYLNETKRNIWLWRALLIVCVTGVLVTLSEASILSLIIGGVVFFSMKSRKMMICSVLIAAMIILAAVCLKINTQAGTERSRVILQDNGRINNWKMIFNHIRTEKYEEQAPFALTGAGPGSYPYLFPSKNKSMFKEAHNEYLECFFIYGLFGFLLFIGMKIEILMKAIRKIKTSMTALPMLCCFIVISVNAFFSFPYHLGAHVFYTATIAGLICNDHS